MPRMQQPSATTLETVLPRALSMDELPAVEVNTSENLAELAHDARNMVTALGLYCELLDEPGVLLPSFRHYGGELKQLAAASRRLVDKLAHMGGDAGASGDTVANSALADEIGPLSVPRAKPRNTQYWEAIPPTMIRDLAWELESNRNLLSALAGPRFHVTVESEGGGYPVRLSSEDLTRILVNLVKNAVEAMPDGGRIQFSLRESPAGPGEDPLLILNVEDNGPGVPEKSCERIFEPGFTTHGTAVHGKEGWHADHRGLGLSITRSIIETAGGHIHVANRDPVGACFQLELPVRDCRG